MTMETESPGIGHNSEPTPHEKAKARVNALVATANKWATERPVITDDEMGKKCSAFIDQITEEMEAADRARKDANRAAQTANNNLWNPLIAPLGVVKELLAPRLKTWVEKKEAERKAALKKAEDEALELLRQAEEAQRQVTIASEAGGDVVGSIVQAAEVKKIAEDAIKAVDRSAKERAGIKSDYGTRTKGLRTSWKFEITDAALIPREYLTHDLVKIGEAVRRAKDPVRDIPGVRIFPDTTLA